MALFAAESHASSSTLHNIRGQRQCVACTQKDLSFQPWRSRAGQRVDGEGWGARQTKIVRKRDTAPKKEHSNTVALPPPVAGLMSEDEFVRDDRFRVVDGRVVEAAAEYENGEKESEDEASSPHKQQHSHARDADSDAAAGSDAAADSDAAAALRIRGVGGEHANSDQGSFFQRGFSLLGSASGSFTLLPSHLQGLASLSQGLPSTSSLPSSAADRREASPSASSSATASRDHDGHGSGLRERGGGEGSAVSLSLPAPALLPATDATAPALMGREDVRRRMSLPQEVGSEENHAQSGRVLDRGGGAQEGEGAVSLARVRGSVLAGTRHPEIRFSSSYGRLCGCICERSVHTLLLLRYLLSSWWCGICLHHGGVIYLLSSMLI